MATRTTNIEGTELERIAQGLVTVMERLSDPENALDKDVFFDINVPAWRFQLEGPDGFIDWLREYCPGGYRITPKRVLPTESSFVLEIEGEYEDHHGAALFFRNLFVCQVEAGRIKDVSYWCTGDWDAETREHHKAEVRLLRP